MKLKKLFLALLAITTIGLAGCNKGEGGGKDPEPAKVDPTGVTLDKFSLSMLIDETFQLTATVTPSNATYELEWKTSNASVATVKDGLITAISSGEADISVLVKGTQFTEKCAVTVAEPFHDYVTDGSVKLSLDYTGKDFFKDGIEKVTLLTPIDGDTAHFSTSSGKTLKARFYGIDTPESTGKVQDWGYEASEFTTTKLKAAKTIVVSSPQSDYGVPDPDSTGSRYVSLIWVNLEKANAAYNEVYLLNLWIVQEGLSKVRNISDIPQYENSFKAAEDQANAYGLCMWSGQHGPHWNPDPEYYEVSLLEIKREVEKSILDQSHLNEYDNMKVTFTGVVSSYSDGTLYVQEFYPIDDDHPEEGEWAGINIFCGMSAIPSKFIEPNTYLRVYGLCKDSETFGFQITDTQGKWKAYGAKETDCKVLLTAEENLEEHSLYTHHYTVEELNTAGKNNDCTYLFCSVSVTGTLTCTRIYKSDDRALTIYFKETTWSVYIPYAYYGDPDSVARWEEEKDFVDKTFRLDQGTYAWHRTQSGKVTYQIIPTNTNTFVCTSLGE